jgi:5-hydroxyisourate hydrolase
VVTLSTQVLDNARGEPAPDVSVRLERERGDRWAVVDTARTDSDGRAHLRVAPYEWSIGRYRLVFDTAGYLGPDAFFPEVTVAFEVTDPERSLHVPLLLSPYGYTIYRES